jgi:hypothetical protein
LQKTDISLLHAPMLSGAEKSTKPQKQLKIKNVKCKIKNDDEGPFSLIKFYYYYFVSRHFEFFKLYLLNFLQKTDISLLHAPMLSGVEKSAKSQLKSQKAGARNFSFFSFIRPRSPDFLIFGFIFIPSYSIKNSKCKMKNLEFKMLLLNTNCFFEIL